MRRAIILSLAAGVMAASSGGAFAQMAFPSSSTAPNEVLVEIDNSMNRHAVDALLRRHRVTGLEAQRLQFSRTTVYRGRIRGRRSLANVVRSLNAEVAVSSAQPNYIFRQGAARKTIRRHRTMSTGR
jgi:hypothetical protein